MRIVFLFEAFCFFLLSAVCHFEQLKDREIFLCATEQALHCVGQVLFCQNSSCVFLNWLRLHIRLVFFAQEYCIVDTDV